jgi:hypothetical protein
LLPFKASTPVEDEDELDLLIVLFSTLFIGLATGLLIGSVVYLIVLVSFFSIGLAIGLIAFIGIDDCLMVLVSFFSIGLAIGLIAFIGNLMVMISVFVTSRDSSSRPSSAFSSSYLSASAFSYWTTFGACS